MHHFLLIFAILQGGVHPAQDLRDPSVVPEKIVKMSRTASEWKKTLSGQQYSVLRQGYTERAFSNTFWNDHRPGLYSCGGCDLPLFKSDSKFDSGTGWPSFFKPIDAKVVLETVDSDGDRLEVRCARCDGHLGHVFNDATGTYNIPKTPTGRRFCMNSAALRFRKVPSGPLK